MKQLIFISLLFWVGVTDAQNFDKAKLDSLFNLIEEYQKGMGSLSIFHNGKEVYQNAKGYRSVREEVPNDADTKYRIGSISKTFTATIIMRLVEEGRLRLETKLTKYYPEVPNADKISIEQLLRHRSGIYNFTNAPEYTSWMEQEQSESDLIQAIIKSGSVFEPDEKAEYSNSNYVLLSFIAEKATSEDFANLLQMYVCKPCGLKQTYFGGKIDLEEKEALSYEREGEWKLSTETDMSIPQGAGSVVSTAAELNQFLHCLFEGELLKEDSKKQMTNIIDNFGIGLFQVPFYQKMGIGHTGGIDGFQSNAFYFPDDNMSLAYISNGVSMAVNDIMIGVLSIYFGMEYDLPEFAEAVVLSSEELDQYLGVYSSPTLPLKLTITKKGNMLIGQGTGQPSFNLEALGDHRFIFDAASLKLEFKPEAQQLILHQGGEYVLTKE
jgi:CubicO group peptidase (beta-lactamase class C family)